MEHRHSAPAEKLAFSVSGFCLAAGISRNLFYALARRGEAPPLTRIGNRTLILMDTAKAWLRSREGVA